MPTHALPPAPQWLPPETLAYVTVTSAAEARKQAGIQPPLSVWGEPALRPFRDHFESQLEARLLAPLARVTGFHPGRLLALAEGQLTLALLPPGDGAPPGSPAIQVLVLDAASRGPELARFLLESRTNAMAALASTPPADLRWRDTVVTRYTFPADRVEAVFDAAFPAPEGIATGNTPAPTPYVIHLASVGSALVAVTDPPAMGRILDRLAPPPAAPAPAAGPPPSPFAADAARGTNALVHGWLNGQAFLRQLTNRPPPFLAGLARTGIELPRALDALGLHQLRGAAFAVRAGPEGWTQDLRLDIPAAGRKGLFAFLQVAPVDASPPAWIPEDVVSFRRVRLPTPAAWSAFERLLRELDPSFLGVLQIFVGYAGKTEDVDFDFEKGLIQRLGDDWMVLTSRASPKQSPGDLLIHASPQAPAILEALRLIASPTYLSTFLPLDAPSPQRRIRDLAGGRQVSVVVSNAPWVDGAAEHLQFGLQRDLVAFARSAPVIEAFLTNAALPRAPRPLAGLPALAEALPRIGGAGGGWFEYASERRLAEAALQSISEADEPLQRLLRWAALSESATRVVAGAGSWLDFERLPANPEPIARHFHLRFQGGQAGPDGFRLTTFRPRAPLPPPPPAKTPPAAAAQVQVPPPVPATNASTNAAAKTPAPAPRPPVPSPIPVPVPVPAAGVPPSAVSAPVPAPAGAKTNSPAPAAPGGTPPAVPAPTNPAPASPQKAAPAATAPAPPPVPGPAPGPVPAPTPK